MGLQIAVVLFPLDVQVSTIDIDSEFYFRWAYKYRGERDAPAVSRFFKRTEDYIFVESVRARKPDTNR